MKHGGRLARRTPLRVTKPLVRRMPLRAVSPKLAAAAVARRPKGGHRIPVDVSVIVLDRSGGRCEIELLGCTVRAAQKHHRVTQKTGGRRRAAQERSDRPSNLLHVCGPCHDFVTDHPAQAYELGWSLRERQEPTREPVMYRCELSYLDDAGGIHSYEEAGA